MARLYAGRKLVGECLFTPNAVALAMKLHPSITHAVELGNGIFGNGSYSRADLQDRLDWIKPDFNAYITMY